MENQDIINLIKDFVSKINVEVKDVIFTEEIHKDGTTTSWFKVDVSDPYFFTSREGEALLAFNHLLKRIIENKMFPNHNINEEAKIPKIIVDINDFHKKKIESIHALAHMMAERARYFKSSIEIDPMSAFERRIIHEFLSDARDLKTESEGSGRSRRVIIRYTGGL